MPAQRARQARPTLAETRQYWRQLKESAETGDTLAAGLLLLVDLLERERSDRLEREAEEEGGSIPQILGRHRRKIMNLIDKMTDVDGDQPRDAAGGHHLGQVLRDAVPSDTIDRACSALDGNPVPGVRDSRRDLGNEHPTQAEKERHHE